MNAKGPKRGRGWASSGGLAPSGRGQFSSFLSLTRSHDPDTLPYHRFLVEGVFDMRDSLRKHGSDLLLRFGKMEQVTRDVVRALRDNGDEVSEVFLQSEVRHERGCCFCKRVPRKLTSLSFFARF